MDPGANLGVKGDSKRIVVAGFVAGGVALAGMLLVNVGSGSEARFLLEAMMPSCSCFTRRSRI